MRLLLIDDRGELWSETSSVIRTSFASAYSDDGFSSYLVKNLGFVAIDIYGTSCQIRVRPAITSQATFETVAVWLAHNRYERIALGYFDQSWQLELYGAPDLITHRLLKLINMKQLARPTDFIAQASGLETLTNYPSLKSIIDHWQPLTEAISLEAASKLMQELTKGRYVIIQHDPTADKLIMTQTGTGYTTLDGSWAEKARGVPVDQQPDREYGRWIKNCYQSALSGESPVVEDVDAIVSTPRYGRYRLRYKRLMLPKTSGENKWLLCSSVLDDRIDLRVTERSDVAIQVG